MRGLSWRFDARAALLVVALGAGGLAAWGTRHYISDRVATLEAQARVPMTEVVVAAVDLLPGARLGPDSVAVREMPREWASDSAILPAQFAQVDGATLAHAARRGEPILWAHIAAARNTPFSAQLRDGRRAVTLAVDEISSVSGLLAPGDVIDVYVSFEHRRKRVTRLLLAAARVMATGQQVVPASVTEGERRFSTVTLDTTPDDAVKLIVARQGGTVTAVLRGAQDGRQAGPVQAGDLASVFGLQAPPPRPTAKVAVVYGDEPPRQMPALAGAVQEEAEPDGAGMEASTAMMQELSAMRDAMQPVLPIGRWAEAAATADPPPEATEPPAPPAARPSGRRTR